MRLAGALVLVMVGVVSGLRAQEAAAPSGEEPKVTAATQAAAPGGAKSEETRSSRQAQVGEAPCPVCGTMNPKNAAFCRNCGEFFEGRFKKEYERIRKKVEAAEQSGIPTAVGVDVKGVPSFTYVRVNMLNEKQVTLLDKPTQRPVESWFNFSLSVAIRQRIRAATMKLGLSVNPPLLNPRNTPAFEGWKDNIAFNFGVYNSLFNLMAAAGGPFWVYTFSPLTGGGIESLGGSYFFTREDYIESSPPGQRYAQLYRDVGTKEAQGQFGGNNTVPGALKGVYLEFYHKPSRVTFKTWPSKAYGMEGDGSFVVFNQVNRRFGAHDLTANYTYLVYNRGLTVKNDREWHAASFRYGYAPDEWKWNFSLEGAVSEGFKPKTGELRQGAAGMFLLSRNNVPNPFAKQLSLQFRAYYATPYYLDDLTAVKSSKPLFSGDQTNYQVMVTTVRPFFSDAVNLYGVVSFRFLTGTLKFVVGTARDLNPTPERFEVTLWSVQPGGEQAKNLAKNIKGPVNYKDLPVIEWSDYQMRLRWTEFDFRTSGTNMVRFAPFSTKVRSLARLNAAYNLKEVLPSFPIPVYYIGRYVLSGVSRENAYYVPPFDTKANFLSSVYHDHSLAIGLRNDFYITTFTAFEQVRLEPAAGLRHRNAFGDGMEVNAWQAGVAYEYYIPGGFELHHQFMVFEKKDPKNPLLDFNGYRMNFWVKKYFQL